MSMKNPLIPAGIEPAAFRIVAQHLNHCATAVPPSHTYIHTYIHTYVHTYIRTLYDFVIQGTHNLPSRSYSSGFPTKTSYMFLISPI